VGRHGATDRCAADGKGDFFLRSFEVDVQRLIRFAIAAVSLRLDQISRLL
jgi:hypothetical protein